MSINVNVSVDGDEAKAIAKRDDTNPDEGKDKYGADAMFADEKNKKYPLGENGKLDEERIRAAWNYINKPKNAEKYSDADLKTIKDKIIAAWKKEIDKAGPPSAAKKDMGDADDSAMSLATKDAGDDDDAMSLATKDMDGDDDGDLVPEEQVDLAQPMCPQCGAPMKDGDCPDCGYKAAKAIAYGAAVKALPNGRLRTRGIVWGGYDLLGDQFARGETDLGASRSFIGMPVYYDHTQGGIKSQIGVVVAADEDEKGINFDIELDRAHRYIDDIKALERAGALGSSTGAIDYLVKRRQGKIKRWIAGEISLTPEPMEPRTHPAFAGKSLSPQATAPQEDTTMGDSQPTNGTGPAGADVAQLVEEVKTLKASVETGQETLSGQIKSVRNDLDEIRSLPAVKNRSAQQAIEAAGGTVGGGLSALADAYHPHSYHNFKALQTVSHPGSPTRQAMYPEGVFGGFVKAVFMSNKPNPAIQRDAIKALDEMYGASSESDSAKALGTQAGVTAAYLIPEQFLPTLMAIAAQNDVFYGRTMVIPADGGEIVIPALDPSTSYSAGQSAYYGGVTVTWSNDDASSIDTTPNFAQVRLKTNALKASTRVANQLMMRSAVAIDAVVSNLLGAAIGRARDYALIQGTGQGQPLGFMFSPAAIDQGGSAIDFATLAAMGDNVIPERDDNYIWIIHSKKRSAIWSLQQTNNTLVTFLPDLRGKPATQLLGRQVLFTDKTPYSNSDVSNTVNLVDPSMYVTAEFQGIALAVSDQARFEQDQTVIRAILSVDGQPWLKSKIAVTSTPDYVSGFVTI
jgi:HK97 family phage major capsid protein